MATVADPSTLVAQIQIFKQILHSLQAGDMARITTTAQPGAPSRASSSRWRPSPTKSNIASARGTVPNLDGALKDSMFIAVMILRTSDMTRDQHESLDGTDCILMDGESSVSELTAELRKLDAIKASMDLDSENWPMWMGAQRPLDCTAERLLSSKPCCLRTA